MRGGQKRSVRALILPMGISKINIRQFGGKMTAELASEYSRSSQWNGTKFVNLDNISSSIPYREIPSFLSRQIRTGVDREPTQPLPSLSFNEDAWTALSPEEFGFVWYGHSNLLLKLGGKTVAVDPMFGGDAAPISPFPVRRYNGDLTKLIGSLPKIDLVLFTHDHYDHLDYDSIQKLKVKVDQYWVALGMGRHLTSWGIPNERIREFDWWQEEQLDNIVITFTPSQHFAGRGLTDRCQSFWGGWSLQTEEVRVWVSGDGGYGPHFHTIGQRLGPFDFGFIEVGQYNQAWSAMHLFPEESVQATIDAGATKIIPIHWGAFTLAQHSWYEPVARFVEEAERLGRSWLVPRLGELVTGSEQQQRQRWWQESIASEP